MATTTSLYKGKEELTMAQYEELTSLDANIDYNITNYPNGGITNAQMTFALTCQRLFKENETFTCTDSGTYEVGHVYKIVVEDEVKSWLDITPEVDLSGRQIVDLSGTTDPDSSIPAVVGQKYTNTTTDTFFYCKSINPVTWASLGGGGSVTTTDKIEQNNTNPVTSGGLYNIFHSARLW